MKKTELRNMLEQVASGALSIDDAVLKLKAAPFNDLGFAKTDTHRAIRQGVAEVIYGEEKRRNR